MHSLDDLPARVNLRQSALASVIAYGDARYQHGLQDGLLLVDKIRGWLTKQPDTKRQRELREWIDAELRRPPYNHVSR